MAYHCLFANNKECDGCGGCKSNKEYICPECGREAETVYVSNVNDEIIGCDKCITEKDAYEVLDEED
jgi:hypothetical protein